MTWLIAGLVVLYLALLISIYFVPLRSAVQRYPDPPSSPAAVPHPEGDDEEAQAEAEAPVGAGR